MAARRWATTARDIFTTGFFWAWAHGPAGVMGTAGVATALSATVEEAITAEAVMRPAEDIGPTDGMIAKVAREGTMSAGAMSIVAEHVPTPATRKNIGAGVSLTGAVDKGIRTAAIDTPDKYLNAG